MKRRLATAVLAIATMCPLLLGQEGIPLSRQTPPPVLDGTAKLVEHYNATQMLRLVIGLRPPHPDEEEQFLRDLQDKTSPNFHHFLTAQEWNARFAPSVQDEQAVVDWAQSQGLTVIQRYPNRLLVGVEAPAGTIERALRVTINRYQLGAKVFFANDRDPVLPSNLAGVVQSIGGLNSVQVLHPSNKSAKEPVFPDYSPGPAAGKGSSGSKDADRSKLPKASKGLKSGGMTPGFTNGAYDPTDMFSSQAYDANALYNQGHCCNPTGNPGVTPPQTSIAIATAGTQDGNDFSGFHNQYPYLADHWQQFYIGGTPSCCDGEGTMDMEWSTAMSNSFGSYVDTAMVYLYDGVDSKFSTFNSIYNQMLSDGYARVMSVSWGCAENDCFDSTDMDTTHAIFNSMIGQGWTLVSISHDGGATTSCVNHDAVNYPGSDPDVVASGGTTLSLLNFGGPVYNSEVAWTGGPDGCGSNDGGSGGGFSVHWGTPYYQSSLGVGSRAVPDVALNADWFNTPQNIFFGGSLSGNGGTSIVAPEMAGFFANENAYLLSLGNICGPFGTSPCAPMGNANPYLYDAGRGTAPHFPFYDITSGCNNNDVTAFYGLGYYCAGAGYDEVTGLGSVNMLQLAWAINWFSTPALGSPSATFSGPATSQWYNTDETVSWSVADAAGTGVAGFTQGWDSIPSDPTSEPTPGSGNSFYSGPQFPNATSGWLDFTGSGVSQGCHTVHVESWNNMGVPSGDQTYGPLCYDTVAPTTSSTQSPIANGYGWNNTSVKVTLNPVDPGSGSTGSGIAATYYAVDNALCSSSNLGACLVYAAPFSITAQAKHVVYFFSKDKAGNFQGTQAAGVNIDETAPKTTASLSGTLSGGVYVSPVTVTLGRTDNLSGVASTTYQVNGGASQTYSAPFTVSTLGSDTVTFHSTDKAGNVETTETVSFTVHSTTTTTLTSSLNPSTSGASVTFTATVAGSGGTPTGSVSFKNGSTMLSTVSLSSGKATYTTSSLSVGSHSMTAVYAGGGNFVGSTSSVLTETVHYKTTTSVASSLNPSTYGAKVTFTATITSSGGTPTGTVTFKNGSSTLGTGSLSSGKATFATSALAVASHSITAVYAGSGNFAGSTSPVLTQVVNKATSSTALVSSLNPSTFGAPVTLTATVSSPGGTPNGSVTFKDGATTLATVSLSSGKAAFATKALTVASHSLTAVYGGNATFAGSTSPVLTQTVKQAATTTTVGSSLNPSTFGSSVTFTANVTSTGGTPTGTVTFKNGSTTLGTGSLSGGKATYATSALSKGSHSITAVYGATVDYLGSTSTVLTQDVN